MHEADDPLRQSLISALGAQYDVLRLIGRGGMGAVYLGRERLLDRLVAIKVLPHESADTETARERFLREARTAARLTHPNVVPLYSFGEAGTTLFYIMGYVQGESLELRLRREGSMAFDDARRILGELASALDHAHSLGIIHRDIKPDNILLEHGTDRPVLTDFGIARQQTAGHTLTGTGMVVGTPLYMSPEQAAGERDIDGRTDLYALGIVGYRMVTGRFPFEGGTFQELMAAHMTREPTPPSVFESEIPDDLDAAIVRCLAKAPAHRWSSAAALRDALGAGDGEVSLPPELEKLPATTSVNLLSGWVGAWFGAIAYAASGDLYWGILPLTVVPAGAVELFLLAKRARKHGLPWQRVKRMALWPPRRWHFWWPRAFRRPGDVWDQLPVPVRRTRQWMSGAALSAMGVFLPVIVLALTLGLRNVAEPRVLGPLILGGVGGMLGVLGIMFGCIAYAMRWGTRMGLASHDRDKLLTEPTWTQRFWRRPDIARLLGVGSTRRQERLETPTDIVAALERVEADIGEPWRAMLADGITVARDVLRHIAHMDDELRALARDNDPAERERLQQRLDAMGATHDGAGRQMRDLMAGQLALMEQLTRRSEDLASRRSRYMELLRTMWLQFSALRAQQAGDALSAAAVTGQLRELCRDVEHALAAEHAVAASPLSAVAPGRATVGGPTPGSQ